MRVWRLSTRDSVSTACNGEGAKKYGGRWNKKGTSVIYTSSTLSLCILEVLIHTDSDLLPKQYAYTIDIPDTLGIEKFTAPLPTDWKNSPAPESLKEIGSDWIATSKFAVLRVPSVIIQTEWNYLINPTHKDFQQIKIQWDHEFSLDQRLN